MFGRTKTYIKDSSVSPNRFIETKKDIPDISNSLLLYLLDKEVNLSNYLITKFEKRIDLIAADIYGNDEYSWILLYLNRITIDDLIRGRKIKYISKDRLNYLFNLIR